MEIKFIYEETDIQDIKVLITDEDETKTKDSKETIKIFCLESLPKDLEPKITEEDDGFIVKTNDGEEALRHIFTYLYLVLQFAKKVLATRPDPLEKIDLENLDMSVLREDIELVRDMSITELANLVKDVPEEN